MLCVRKMYSVSLIADGDDLQEFIDNSDLLISNQDIVQV